MYVDWLLVLNIIRVLFIIIILVYASYHDIKTRMITNQLWIILGLVAVSLLECQLFVEFGLDAFQFVLATIPITILFMSFLICEDVIDFDKGKLSDSWGFLIALSGFAFFYLFIFTIPDDTIENQPQNSQLFTPIILLLLFFMLIQFLLNYLEHRAYLSYQRVLKLKKKTKTKKKNQITTKKAGADQIEMQESSSIDEKMAYALFFGLLSAMIISFLMTDIIPIKIVRYFGAFLIVIIPIILIILYFKYQTEETSEKKDNSSKDNSDADGANDIDISIAELQFKPPSKFLYLVLFSCLVFSGFIVIIYYSILDAFDNILVQLFILMVWILIFYGFYNIGLPRGGADTKALMAMVILFPAYPIIQWISGNTAFFSILDRFPVIGYLFPFAFTVLVNSAFIMLFFIIGLLFYNGGQHNLKFPHAILGYKLPIKEVPHKFVWLMEKITDGKRKLITFPSNDLDLDHELKLLRKAKIKEVWVTPKIPFIIPMTIGVVLSVIIGNIMFLIIGALI